MRLFHPDLFTEWTLNQCSVFSILTVCGLKMARIKFFLQRGKFGLSNMELFKDDTFRRAETTAT